MSEHFLYVFPDEEHFAENGKITLRWRPGQQIFDVEGELSVNNALHTIQVFPDAFSPEECCKVIEFGEKAVLQTAGVVKGPAGHRISNIAWLQPTAEVQWLFHKLAMLITRANKSYGFELKGFVEALQYTVYGEGEYFDWHIDLGADTTSARKLSVTVQLVSSDTYAGGDLEFINARQLESPRTLGTTIVFPSYLAHQVTPVTRGVRRSLVAWAYGSRFR
ncbi:MAG: 2OG-Fe(II) oxygenase [Burkholderiales bacterium]